MSMSGTPKEKTDQALIDAFLKKGGKVTKGKTKPMKHELGLSNNAVSYTHLTLPTIYSV